ncbi:prephenate dehydratase [Streptomyces nigra]|uniref:prephenate dehydratase n=1 Tax=Streptomyces nigra TaxID=1827580 RepID=UPI003647553D
MSLSTKYGYLGPEGTFTERALRTLPEAATHELVPWPSIPAALDAVRRGDTQAAMVPLENSVEGAVPATVDGLADGDPLVIVREVCLPITFALLARPGTKLHEIKTVTGHSHAQPQVRKWLAAHLPDAEWQCASSNAEGARFVRDGHFDAAVAGEFTGVKYGLQPLVTDIHDVAGATTRFVLASRPERAVPPTGSDKTTLFVHLVDDRPDALLELMLALSAFGVNLLRIETRPTGEGLGRYYFSIDCEGHITDVRVGEAVKNLRRICPHVQFLGSYPRAEDGVYANRTPPATDEQFTEADEWLARCLGIPL